MQDYWEFVAPPIDLLIAGYMGFKPKKRPGAPTQTSDLGDLLRMFPGGMIQ
jgi:hypothetical protein